jgi:hypothetical protein
MPITSSIVTDSSSMIIPYKLGIISAHEYINALIARGPVFIARIENINAAQ